jgi:hypothetical protein
VARAVRGYRDEILTHSYGTVSSKTQLYTTAMLGLNAGYLTKFDDTGAYTFFGLVNEDEGNPVVPSDGTTSATAGANSLGVDVRQPPAFELNIASVAITDIGRRVYALDDQTGTLDPSATTYGNLIGTVKDLIFAADGGSPVANYALVAPIYGTPVGGRLQVFSASGAIQQRSSIVWLKGNSALAMTLANPTTLVQDGMTIEIIETGTGAHTVTTGSNGINGASHIATFGGAAGDNLVLIALGGSWYVESSVGVVLS